MNEERTKTNRVKELLRLPLKEYKKLYPNIKVDMADKKLKKAFVYQVLLNEHFSECAMNYLKEERYQLIAVYKRVHNLVKKYKKKKVINIPQEELSLLKDIRNTRINPNVSMIISTKRLHDLSTKVARYIDNNLINSEDENLKNIRLRILNIFLNLVKNKTGCLEYIK